MGRSRADTFIAVYRGRTASDARLVAVTSDPDILASVVTRILAGRIRVADDPVVAGIDRARHRGLKLIRRELREPIPDASAVESRR